MTDLERAATVAVRDCLGLKNHERLLVLTDPVLAHLARVLVEAARQIAREVILLGRSTAKSRRHRSPSPWPASTPSSP